jgi:AraC-like DNA-binding protein
MSPYEIAPQSALQDSIKCFWTLEEPRELYNRDAILPDSYVELIVNIGAPLLWETEHGTHELPSVFLLGLQKKPLKLHTTGLSQLVAMRLYAWSVIPLLDLNVALGETPIIALDETWQKLAPMLATKAARGGYAEAAACLEQFVSDKQRQNSRIELTPLQMAGELLYATQGQVRISDLAAHASLSTSQFERRFKQMTGVAPKTLARLIRFEAVRDSLLTDTARSMTDLALEFGYSDQAHFIHDFKNFAACTPRELAQKNAEFLQYP